MQSGKRARDNLEGIRARTLREVVQGAPSTLELRFRRPRVKCSRVALQLSAERTTRIPYLFRVCLIGGFVPSLPRIVRSGTRSSLRPRDSGNPAG